MSEQIHTCPSLDGCNFTTDEIGEQTDHAAEYADPQWPVTPAGRASRAADSRDENDQDGADE